MEANQHIDASPMLGEECVINLNDDEKDSIRAITDRLSLWDIANLDTDDIFTQVQIAQKEIPHSLASTLIDFRRNSNNYGTLLIRNLPVDHALPPTPNGNQKAFSKTSVSEYALLMLMMYLGEPIGYADEKEGAIIQNTFPVAGQEERLENTGSVYLDFHTESCFHPNKPDYVGLFCLRSDHDQIARTASASIYRAIHKVPSKLISILRQPLYRARVSTAYVKPGEPALYSPFMPILSGDTVEPDLCVNFFGMEAKNPIAQLAFDSLKAALLQVAVDCVLLPGDLLIVDNRVAAHGRTGFHPRYDGNDRWLQRLFVVEDFRLSKPSRYRGKHVCLPLSVEFFTHSDESTK
ncbi:TauD/TfdA family dioxygenase [Dictyobacter formicarum]|uniref:L-asparagine oxygenase n=1 Tax=Dictyobacter formicarum TaxID=2778368 RepID=A0ABQ3VJT7_9CHLR|nr:TauD/TfdA family dioxygenase [Dictyobacter formicarum]GHO86474.1 L-asparagine oxygenase [Dictyobacter formicarum]